MKNPDFDVIIVGGSYAGLSAALSLGRSLRHVLVVDSGAPCNAPTPHSHNFLTHDGKRPADISAIARQEVARYPSVSFRDGMVISGERTPDGFLLSTGDGARFTARRLIFASGIKDQLPDIPGFAECWGKTVIHCPYCHGYEAKGVATGLLADGDMVMHLAALVGNLAPDLTVFSNGPSQLTAEQRDRPARNGVGLVETPVAEISHTGGMIRAVVLQDGTEVSLAALYARVPFVQHCEVTASLGCDFDEMGYIKVDGLQKTSVGGIFACGDMTTPMRSVAGAVASGSFTGAVVNRELAEEAFR